MSILPLTKAERQAEREDIERRIEAIHAIATSDGTIHADGSGHIIDMVKALAVHLEHLYRGQLGR